MGRPMAVPLRRVPPTDHLQAHRRADLRLKDRNTALPLKGSNMGLHPRDRAMARRRRIRAMGRLPAAKTAWPGNTARRPEGTPRNGAPIIRISAGDCSASRNDRNNSKAGIRRDRKVRHPKTGRRKAPPLLISKPDWQARRGISPPRAACRAGRDRVRHLEAERGVARLWMFAWVSISHSGRQKSLVVTRSRRNMRMPAHTVLPRSGRRRFPSDALPVTWTCRASAA